LQREKALMDKLERLDCPALHEIYELVDKIRGDELQTAERKIKVGFTRIRTKLSKVSKLCKEARKQLLEMRDGKDREDQEGGGEG
jgi:hypothetical protein